MIADSIGSRNLKLNRFTHGKIMIRCAVTGRGDKRGTSWSVISVIGEHGRRKQHPSIEGFEPQQPTSRWP